MGTVFTIKLYAPDSVAAQSAVKAAFQRIETLEQVMSDYRADSELMLLCDQPYGKPVSVSSDLFRILQVSQKFSKLSDGAFDVTVGPYVRLWRFSHKRKTLPSAEDLAKARASVGWKKVRLNEKNQTVTLLAPGMRLDLGGIGKGYAADEVLKILQQRGFNRSLVAGSGDIAVGDPPPGKAGWSVGIGEIDAPEVLNRNVLLKNAGISTSGDTEQFVEIEGVRYSHIVNPRTGLGLTERLQDTIIGPNATTTDALDTSVCVLGVEAGLRLANSLPHAAAVIFKNENRKIFYSRNWKKIARAPIQSRP